MTSKKRHTDSLSIGWFYVTSDARNCGVAFNRSRETSPQMTRRAARYERRFFLPVFS